MGVDELVDVATQPGQRGCVERHAVADLIGGGRQDAVAHQLASEPGRGLVERADEFDEFDDGARLESRGVRRSRLRAVRGPRG